MLIQGFSEKRAHNRGVHAPGFHACMGNMSSTTVTAAMSTTMTPMIPSTNDLGLFTLHIRRSMGHFLVVDLQGVGHLLTDPSIHTRDPERFKLSDTNLNEEGFKFFFATHQCNAICRELGLRSERHMLCSGVYHFRDIWPTMESTVCWSNKLCRRIIRLSTAKKPDEFPGYH